jgi:hypothetical protein
VISFIYSTKYYSHSRTSSGIVFDNIIVTDDENVAKSLTEQTFDVKREQEKIYQTATTETTGILKTLMDATEEKPW